MGNPPKKHHFVPRSYLKRFTDSTGFLHVCDRNLRNWRRQRPKEVMTIGAYYQQHWVPNGVDPNILEKGLGEWLEISAKDALDRLIHSPSMLTDDDTATLLTYLEFQRIRVPRQAETAKALMRETILNIAPAEAASAIRSGAFQLTMKDSARFDYMRMILGNLHTWFARMDWEIVQSEDGSVFVTTDSPVSFYNPACPPPAEPGIALAGTIVFFPLSSRHLLLMRHPECRSDPPLKVLSEPVLDSGVIEITTGTVWKQEVVVNANWKLVQLADRLVVAESKEALQQCDCL